MAILNYSFPGKYQSYRFTINFGIPTRAAGSGVVQLPFIGYNIDGSLIDLTVAQYSTDGITYHNATIVYVEDTIDLVFGPDGVSHTFNWNGALDLGSNLFNTNIFFRMRATGTDYLTPMATTNFTIVKNVTSGSKEDHLVFPNSYKGKPGHSLLNIFKGSK